MIKEYKLKNGSTRYLVQVYLGKDSRGKIRKTTRRGFKSLKEAKLAEARILNDNPINKPVSRTYKEVFNLWETQYYNEVRESTYHKTMTIFKLHILPVLGSLAIEDINPLEIQELVNKWSNEFVRYKIMVRYLDKVFQKAVKMDLISKSPVDKVDLPREKKSNNDFENFYSKDQLNELLDTLEKNDNKKWLALFRLLAYSGMRQGELLALTWKDIHFKDLTVDINKALTRGIGNSLIVQPPKSQSSIRLITVDQETMNILKLWQMEQKKILMLIGKRSNSQLVFPVDSTNKHMTSSQIRKNLIKAQEQAGLPNITAHGLRHTHCSLLFEAGVSMEVVKKRLGHSDIQTTMNIYTHVTKERQEETATQFAKFMTS
ncbi:tyrosine-type recombinase/integrase [Facklamia sp. P9177]|uniref:site-specific integrase n=1 Tax=Facklamia sp. P9177 TaxID=3421945 RepID=UPI003D17D3D3